jgi:hypothetical protein
VGFGADGFEKHEGGVGYVGGAYIALSAMCAIIEAV